MTNERFVGKFCIFGDERNAKDMYICLVDDIKNDIEVFSIKFALFNSK